MYFLDWGVCFPDTSSVPILPTPSGGFLSSFFSFSSLHNPEDKKKCIHSIITAFHVIGNGKVTAGSHYPRDRGGLRVGWAWEEGAWVPLRHTHSDTPGHKARAASNPENLLRKANLHCPDRRFSLGQIFFLPFLPLAFAPSSICHSCRVPQP